MLIIAPKGLSKKMELIDFFSKRPDDGNNDYNNDDFFLHNGWLTKGVNPLSANPTKLLNKLKY